MLLQKKYKDKDLEPVDCDLSLIYRCPKCNIEHWLSLNEARTKNFKVVCDCDAIFRVKRVKGIKIKYIEDKEIVKEEVEQQPMQPVLPVVQKPSIDLDRKSTRLNSSHVSESRMPSSA